MKGGWSRLARRWVRYQYLRILRINDTPDKIARGFALGVVIGILPTFGLGVLLALFLAGPLKMNKASAVIGSLVMNPWTAPFFWTLSYLTGSLMFGYGPAETMAALKEMRVQGSPWEAMLTKRLVLPYAAGNVAITAMAAATAYVSCLWAVNAYRRAKTKKLLKRQGLRH